mmetsp:Transcript_22014/g.34211  ORF Transcript_22014/g.34211 Transcript_22014/m.34211 type:complete len:159 (-) Transcript_22014:54-530(-)|eukprot:CAMPEP_0194293040 /NCGR_PEP_ID=MMETSP0169-20130528/47002_1 /TAXON_ID=218684 /ORGANISM="Corethron pennatum, Strain L29A3" /LENGTH=158 /DNA_ID=CAMNT_0039041409 /DNA_START=73 /DNA_END=549 /DNA_ORIENTATION=+
MKSTYVSVSYSCPLGRLAPPPFPIPDGCAVVASFKPAAGDYSYGGYADHGPISPVPREGGPYAALLARVLAARNHSDKYLTEVIGKEKAASKAAEAVDGEEKWGEPADKSGGKGGTKKKGRGSNAKRNRRNQLVEDRLRARGDVGDPSSGDKRPRPKM